ncbi:MAG: hypothetical protein R3B97_16815 [Dehalococcoidia bacterium]|nr:hypothetical protein [Dehalococcoidia bacterium]
MNDESHPRDGMSSGHARLLDRISLTRELAAVEKFLAEPGAHYVCSPPRGSLPGLDRERLALETVAVGVDSDGAVQAAAWLELPEEPGQASVGLMVLGAHQQWYAGAAQMLAILVREAETRGLHQVMTCLTRSGPDPVGEFREIGLRVVSQFTIGSTMELVIELEKSS